MRNMKVYYITVLVAALLLVLHPSPATAADEMRQGLAAGNNHHPRACNSEDARCIALQRDVCDPWNITASDTCTFVQVDKFCMEDVHSINYLALFYCNNKMAMIFALITWMLVLFLVMTVTAEAFLCPAIEFLSEWLGLAPDIAGVTLFAFASGAPDLFTQVAALAAGDHVDIELAVSATFGGGLFIICVVLAAVILACPDDLQVPDRRAFTRDSLAYLVSSTITLGLLWLGRLTLLDGFMLMAGYFVYLGICLATRSSTVGGTGGSTGAHGAHHHHQNNNNQYSAVSPHAMHGLHAGNGLQHGAAGGGSGVAEAWQAAEEEDAREVEMVPFTLAVEDPGSPIGLGSIPSAEVIIGGRKGISTPKIPLSPGTAATYEKRRVRSGSLAVDAVLELELGAPTGTTQMSTPSKPQSSSLSGLSNGDIYDTSLLGGGGAGRGGVAGIIIYAFQQWLRDLPETLNECLHLHGKHGLRRWFAYATAPLVLFMHLTMPAVGRGTFGMAYAAALSIIAPLFFLISAHLGPSVLGTSSFITFWVSSSLVIFTLVFAIQPVGGIGGGIGGGAGASTSSSILRPRRTLLLACLAFAQSIVWLNSTADEVVALFESVGRIWNIRRDTLGATVLAWGETVPDLVAVVSIAKSGQGTMAIAACFGGPVFNLLVSMGGPIVIAAGKNGALPYVMTSGVVVLVGSTVGVLAFLLVAVPMRFKWKLPRKLGWGLLGFYAVSQVVFLLAEGEVL